jgi:ribosome biogenesis protein Nip4
LQDRRQKKPESPRKELLNQFIENNINNFNEEEKKVFREIVEGIETQSNYLIVIEHTNKYFESIRN